MAGHRVIGRLRYQAISAAGKHVTREVPGDALVAFWRPHPGERPRPFLAQSPDRSSQAGTSRRARPLGAGVDKGRAIAERIPTARFVQLDRVDHIPFLGAPDQITEEVQEFLTGIRGSPDRDRVLTAVIFTDIVGSTEPVGQVGDRR